MFVFFFFLWIQFYCCLHTWKKIWLILRDKESFELKATLAASTFHHLALTQSWDCQLQGSFDALCQSVVWNFRIQSWITRCTTDLICDIKRSPNYFVAYINLCKRKSMFISQYILMSKIYYKWKKEKKEKKRKKGVLTCNLWDCPRDLGNEKFGERKEMGKCCDIFVHNSRCWEGLTEEIP